MRWKKGFTHAKAYYEEHGNLDVRKEYVCDDGYKLGSWILNNRNARVNSSIGRVLDDNRIKRLDEIGMIWKKNNLIWERNYLAAAKYYAEHGDFNMPTNYVTEDGIRLGNWLNSLKRTRKGATKGKPLTDEQIERLDMIGMNWDTKNDAQWEAHYRDACEFFKKYGHLDIPVAYKAKNGTRLGEWIRCQRRDTKLTREKRARLDKIGMVWKHEDSWEKRYHLAENYYREHGDLNMSQKYVVDNIWVGKWVYEQRRKKKKGLLNEQQISLLDNIGIKWDIRKHAVNN